MNKSFPDTDQFQDLNLDMDSNLLGSLDNNLQEKKEKEMKIDNHVYKNNIDLDDHLEKIFTDTSKSFQDKKQEILILNTIKLYFKDIMSKRGEEASYLQWESKLVKDFLHYLLNPWYEIDKSQIDYIKKTFLEIKFKETISLDFELFISGLIERHTLWDLSWYYNFILGDYKKKLEKKNKIEELKANNNYTYFEKYINNFKFNDKLKQEIFNYFSIKINQNEKFEDVLSKLQGRQLRNTNYLKKELKRLEVWNFFSNILFKKTTESKKVLLKKELEQTEEQWRLLWEYLDSLDSKKNELLNKFDSLLNKVYRIEKGIDKWEINFELRCNQLIESFIKFEVPVRFKETLTKSLKKEIVLIINKIKPILKDVKAEIDEEIKAEIKAEEARIKREDLETKERERIAKEKREQANLIKEFWNQMMNLKLIDKLKELSDDCSNTINDLESNIEEIIDSINDLKDDIKTESDREVKKRNRKDLEEKEEDAKEEIQEIKETLRGYNSLYNKIEKLLEKFYSENTNLKLFFKICIFIENSYRKIEIADEIESEAYYEASSYWDDIQEELKKLEQSNGGIKKSEQEILYNKKDYIMKGDYL